MNEIPSVLQNIKKFNFINETKIFNEIQNNNKILVFDLRSKSDYEKMSLPDSVNLPFDEKPHEFFENFIGNISPELSDDTAVKDMLCKFRRFYIAIIFSEENFHRKEIINYEAGKLRSHEALYKALCLYHSLSTNKVREMGIYLKGFNAIFDKYFFIVRNDLNEPLFT
jgi:rhodanese-related sulfurtransferase